MTPNLLTDDKEYRLRKTDFIAHSIWEINMSNYSHLSCPVPFKLGYVCSGSKDDGNYIDNEDELIGLSGFDRLLKIMDLINRDIKISQLNRTINGWVVDAELTQYKHKCGMYVYANKMTKDDKTVYIIDEGEYPDCGETVLSMFADNKTVLELFKVDFGIKNKIKAETYVEQTV